MSKSAASRKNFLKNRYSKYWFNAREKRYGISRYDKQLCKLLIEKSKKNCNFLDVGIGTGFPFATFLSHKGFSVSGIDISPLLIAKCKKLDNRILAEVGDSDNLGFPNSSFDVVYSFHSTWYFDDIERSIHEMFRVCKKGGFVIFDLSNSLNSQISKRYSFNLFRSSTVIGKFLNYFINFWKLISKNDNRNWENIVVEKPTNPEQIMEKFSLESSSYKFFYKDYKGSIITVTNKEILPNHPRLIFVAKKK